MELAIKGHKTRGGEVIQLLEMLGGENWFNIGGTADSYCYYIDDNDHKIHLNCLPANIENIIVFTIEEFEKLYPYKVGDKVITQFNKVYKIKEMMWNNKEIVYALGDGDGTICWYNTAELRPYKEENMEEKEDEPKAPILSNRYDYTEGKCGYVIPDGYECDYIKEGFQTEIILKPKKPTYPKDYEECFNICFGNKHHIVQVVGLDGLGDNKKLFESFIKLKICRDAYWEIAGKQLGLDKPWEPDYDSGVNKYGIISMNGVVQKSNPTTNWERHLNKVLDFPTPEMRDAFFENFKDLIEECKELL